MEREPSNHEVNMIKVYRGVFPWSAAEYNWIIAAFDERRKNKNENLKLAEDLTHIKEEMEHMRGKELENFQSLALFSDIFMKRYPKKLDFEAHFFRFHQINRFMQTYHNDLIKLKLVTVQGGKHHIAPQLIDSLCTLLYNQEETDESGDFSCTFSYKEVIAVTKAKLNAHLN